jgi:hypothetical protein
MLKQSPHTTKQKWGEFSAFSIEAAELCNTNTNTTSRRKKKMMTENFNLALFERIFTSSKTPTRKAFLELSNSN